MKPSKPHILSFLIADKVIQEKHSNKWSAIGIFDRVYVQKFPCMHATLALYVKLSDAEGKYAIRVEFSDAEGTKLGVFENVELQVNSRNDNFSDW